MTCKCKSINHTEKVNMCASVAKKYEWCPALKTFVRWSRSVAESGRLVISTP